MNTSQKTRLILLLGGAAAPLLGVAVFAIQLEIVYAEGRFRDFLQPVFLVLFLSLRISVCKKEVHETE